MRPLKQLTFDAFQDMLATTFAAIADQRDPRRITWELPAVLMSAVAMLFFQYPSLLEYQRRMQQRTGRSHMERVFQVEELPSDTQMREILDGMLTEPLRHVLPQTFAQMRPLVQVGGVTGDDALQPEAAVLQQHFSLNKTQGGQASTNMNSKAKGSRRERQARKILEAQGFYVVKASGSLGVCDLVALGVDGVRLVQGKSNCRPRSAEMARLREFPSPTYARKEVWVFVDHLPGPGIEVVTNQRRN